MGYFLKLMLTLSLDWFITIILCQRVIRGFKQIKITSIYLDHQGLHDCIIVANCIGIVLQ